MLNKSILRKQIVLVLKTIYDPEIPVNIWDLGLIYGIEVYPLDADHNPPKKIHLANQSQDKKNQSQDKLCDTSFSIENYNCRIIMTLTSPNCPVIDTLPEEIRLAVLNIPAIEEVVVSLTWEPGWTQDLMSLEAKMELGLL